MDVLILVIFIIVVGSLLAMAVVLLNGKGAFLIAGYNTMSAREKATYDERALCRSMGKLMLAVTLAIALVFVALLIDQSWLLYSGIALSVVLPLGYLVYANTGNRFRRAPGIEVAALPQSGGAKPLAKRVTAIVATVATVITCLMVGIGLYLGSREPVATVLEDAIQIEAMYGLTIEFAEIDGITLLESRMDDMDAGSRRNGYAGGGIWKGHFRSDTLGETLLFVDARTAPTIWIERQGQEDVYLSFRDSEKTRELYQELMATARWGS
ncbi:MAG: DUF3784 domain-containing protein [Coriobacteriales bacterium]|jgi:hypothetical protein|nr:DUF3784 domain-containing protein [Coriobacteriales bacterium]